MNHNSLCFKQKVNFLQQKHRPHERTGFILPFSSTTLLCHSQQSPPVTRSQTNSTNTLMLLMTSWPTWIPLIIVLSEVPSVNIYLPELHESKDYNSENNVPKNGVISVSLGVLNLRLIVFLKWMSEPKEKLSTWYRDWWVRVCCLCGTGSQTKWWTALSGLHKSSCWGTLLRPHYYSPWSREAVDSTCNLCWEYCS